MGHAATVRWAVHLPTFTDPGRLVDLAVSAERHGWDGCFLWDHLLGSVDQPMPIVDTWVALGAIAQATERITIGTAVTPVPRRKPQELARQAVTVDRLSGGRLIMGVGLGTPVKAEYAAFGEPPDHRVLAAKLDEGLTVLNGLWSGAPFSHHGEHFTVTQATFLPTPVQQPRIPIWAACSSPRGRPLERAARWDGAILANESRGTIQSWTTDELRDVRHEIRRRRGDDRPFDLAVVTGDPSADADAYTTAGVSWILVTGWLDQLSTMIESGPPGPAPRA